MYFLFESPHAPIRLVADMRFLVKQFIGAFSEPTMMIVTELMRGGTLQKYLWSIRPNSPHLKISITLALGISQAMEYLHANSILHRDLKPSNPLYFYSLNFTS